MDPDIARILAEMAAAGGPPAHELPVELMRAASDVNGRRLGGPGEQVAEILDRAVPGPAGEVRVRCYRPAASGALPVVAWFHGGGWVVGSLDGFDPLCRALANASGALVVSVAYRLAPEHPFPAGLEDCVAAARWLRAHAGELGADPERLALGGDSAGGNLATVVARRLRDAAEPAPRMQALVYPVCDGGCATPSYRECEDGHGLSAAEMHRFFALYLGGASALHPDVSPLRADDLSNLPPAFVLTAEHDPLRDEAESYARALQDAGVSVTLRRYEGAVHGFLRWHGAAAISRRAVQEVGAALRAGLTR